jgi:hypothetical protein
MNNLEKKGGWRLSGGGLLVEDILLCNATKYNPKQRNIQYIVKAR